MKKLKVFLVCMLTLTGVSMSVEGQGVTLRAHIANSQKANAGDTSPAHSGMYTFKADGTDFRLMSGSTDVSGAFGGLWSDGYYYQTNASTRNPSNPSVVFRGIVKYDTKSWDAVSITPIERGSMSMDMVDDNGVIYGCFYHPTKNGFVFSKMSMLPEKNYPVTMISVMPMPMSAMGITRDGEIYGIGDDGILYKINKKDGSTTYIGGTGVTPTALCSAAIDQKTGKMYWTAITDRDGGAIYEIDLSNGKTTLMAKLPYNDQIVGLDVVFEPEAKAPSRPERFSAEFSNGSLTGKVSFVIPSVTCDGVAGTDEVEYTVFANGDVISTGKSHYGAQVETECTLPEDGYYEFRVRLTNKAGDSYKAGTGMYVGNDIPVSPKPALSYANNKFTVKWSGVSTSENGGYMDVSKIRYRITRKPDGKVVADDYAGVSFTDDMTMPEEYTVFHYEVDAKCNGKVSKPGISNKLGIGVIQPPYLQSFEDASSILNYTILDTNQDKRQWTYFANGKVMRAWYTTGKPQDDWLITPAIKLEAGKAYRMSLDASLYDDKNPETFEVAIGKTPTATGMTKTVIAKTDVKTKTEFVNYDEYITVSETGNYYIGVHSCSEAAYSYLEVTNISLEAPISSSAPGACGEFVVKADENGARKVVITGKMPSETVSGQQLTSIDKLEIYRSGELLTTIEGKKPGETFSYTDETVPVSASYKYEAIGYNTDGEGRKTWSKLFVGVKTPSPVTDVKISESTTKGVAHITWTAPATDIDNSPLSAEHITYTIVQPGKSTTNLIVENLKETSYDWTVTDSEQAMAYVGIYAVTDGGVSEPVLSEMIPVGVAYRLPYEESFKNGSHSSVMGTRNYNLSATWTYYADGGLTGITSADNDNGYIASKVNVMGPVSSMIFTGKVDLTKAVDPQLSFYVYNLRSTTSTNKTNNNKVEVMVKVTGEDNDFRTLQAEKTVDELCGEVPEERWFPVRVSLAGLKGKTVQLGLKCTVGKYQYNILDKIRVSESYGDNLSVDGLGVPGKVRANSEFTVKVPVRNLGSNEASDYTVELYRDNGTTPAAVRQGVSIKPDEVATYEFAQTLGMGLTDGALYHAKVVYGKDKDMSDNESEPVRIELRPSDKPAPTGLTAVKEATGSVSLNWSAPELGTLGSPYSVFEGFDRYDSFTHSEIGEWKMVDADKKPVGSFNGVYVPGIVADKTLASFFVFDCEGDLFNKSFDAFSGTKYLASLFRQDDGKVDDWAISPELSGNAQTIKLTAKSYNNRYNESFEVLVSTGGVNTSDFKSLAVKEQISGDWTQYTFDIPTGTKYFAIRNIGAAAFMLMVDDVEYEAAPLKVTGYNVYRNGVKINDTPVITTAYTDGNPGSEPSYMVSAVYTNDESDPSAPAGLSGIEDVTGDDWNVYVADRQIVIDVMTPCSIQLTSVSGIVVYGGVIDRPTSIPVTPGVYLVKAGSKVTKLTVK